VPRPPARRGDAEVVAAGEQATAAGDDAGSTVTTRLHGLESRVAVAEKSTRALLVEVVRLQAATHQAGGRGGGPSARGHQAGARGGGPSSGRAGGRHEAGDMIDSKHTKLDARQT